MATLNRSSSSFCRSASSFFFSCKNRVPCGRVSHKDCSHFLVFDWAALVLHLRDRIVLILNKPCVASHHITLLQRFSCRCKSSHFCTLALLFLFFSPNVLSSTTYPPLTHPFRCTFKLDSLYFLLLFRFCFVCRFLGLCLRLRFLFRHDEENDR